MTAGETVPHVAEQLAELLRKIVGRWLTPIALQRERGERIGPRRAADAEIDASGKERAQHAERRGHFQRTVVRHHHAAASDAHARGDRRDRADERFGARAREHRRAVVLGDPVSVIAQRVREPREIDRMAQRIGAG